MVPRRKKADLNDPGKAKAFAVNSPIRAKILMFLKDSSPATQTEVANEVKLAVSSARYHIGVLKKAGFVEPAGTRPGPNSITEKLFRLSENISVKGPEETGGMDAMLNPMKEALRVASRLMKENEGLPAGGFVIDGINADRNDVFKAISKISDIVQDLRKKKPKKDSPDAGIECGMLLAYYPVNTTLKNFRNMADRQELKTTDPEYKDMAELAGKSIPELKKIACDPNEHWGYIAFKLLGESGDKSVIPFLMANLDSKRKWVQIHVVWGLNHLLNLGTFNEDDPSEKKKKVLKAYKTWWKENRE